MILPLAIVERSPMDEYVEKYKTLEESLKHNVTDAFNLYNELRVLKQMQEYCPAEDTKSIRSLVKQYNKIITEKEDRFLRLTKFSDYPALTMAAYPDANFLSADKYKRKIKSINDSFNNDYYILDANMYLYNRGIIKNKEELLENIDEINLSDLAGEIDLSKLADNLNNRDIAYHVDTSDIEVDHDVLVEKIDLDELSEKIAKKLLERVISKINS